MRIVKSLLLGSAAGLVAVAGAQAADLPVKAKPVEYVKICNLYGDGFFYIPGTETCVRIGGAVQADYYYNALGNGHPHYNLGDGAQDRTVSPHATRGRIDLGLDTRTQTQWGTLRTYEVWRIDNADQGTDTIRNVRGFIQWAGFTFGHTKSYADPYGSWGGSDMASLLQAQTHADTGANGTNQISYTWELGNGAVLVIGADERKNSPLVNLSTAAQITVGGTPTTSRAGMVAPDPYVAFRMDQAWGKFSAAIHASNNNALYYTAATPGFANCLGTAGGPTVAIPAGPQAGGNTMCDHPKDQMGWASLNGIEIKLPWIAAGDRFGAFFNYGVGATRYAGGTNLVGAGLFGGGNNVATGWVTDGVYLNGLGIQQTTAWAVGVAYEHWWTPQLKSAILASHSENKYNNLVVAGGWFCGKGGAAAQSIAQVDATQVCDPSFKFTDFHVNTSWYPVPGFRLGVEVAYTMIDTALDGQQLNLTKTQGARPTGIYTARDQNIVSAVFRANRGFGGVGE